MNHSDRLVFARIIANGMRKQASMTKAAGPLRMLGKVTGYAKNKLPQMVGGTKDFFKGVAQNSKNQWAQGMEEGATKALGGKPVMKLPPGAAGSSAGSAFERPTLPAAVTTPPSFASPHRTRSMSIDQAAGLKLPPGVQPRPQYLSPGGLMNPELRNQHLDTLTRNVKPPTPAAPEAAATEAVRPQKYDAAADAGTAVNPSALVKATPTAVEQSAPAPNWTYGARPQPQQRPGLWDINKAVAGKNWEAFKALPGWKKGLAGYGAATAATAPSTYANNAKAEWQQEHPIMSFMGRTFGGMPQYKEHSYLAPSFLQG